MEMSQLCDLCLDGTAARDFCVDCRQSYCGPDADRHRKMTSSFGHLLIPIGEAVNTTPLISQFCCDHAGNLLQLHCDTCATTHGSTFVCQLCLHFDHRGHEVSTLLNAWNTLRQPLCRSNDALRKRADEMYQREKAAISCNSSLRSACQKTKDELNTVFTQIHIRLDAAKEAVHQRIEQLETVYLAALQEQVAEAHNDRLEANILCYEIKNSLSNQLDMTSSNHRLRQSIETTAALVKHVELLMESTPQQRWSLRAPASFSLVGTDAFLSAIDGALQTLQIADDGPFPPNCDIHPAEAIATIVPASSGTEFRPIRISIKLRNAVGGACNTMTPDRISVRVERHTGPTMATIGGTASDVPPVEVSLGPCENPNEASPLGPCETSVGAPPAGDNDPQGPPSPSRRWALAVPSVSSSRRQTSDHPAPTGCSSLSTHSFSALSSSRYLAH